MREGQSFFLSLLDFVAFSSDIICLPKGHIWGNLPLVPTVGTVCRRFMTQPFPLWSSWLQQNNEKQRLLRADSWKAFVLHEEWCLLEWLSYLNGWIYLPFKFWIYIWIFKIAEKIFYDEEFHIYVHIYIYIYINLTGNLLTHSFGEYSLLYRQSYVPEWVTYSLHAVFIGQETFCVFYFFFFWSIVTPFPLFEPFPPILMNRKLLLIKCKLMEVS